MSTGRAADEKSPLDGYEIGARAGGHLPVLEALWAFLTDDTSDEPSSNKALLGTAWVVGLLSPAVWRQCDAWSFAPNAPTPSTAMTTTNLRLSALVALVLLFSWAIVHQTRGRPATTALTCVTSICACWLGRLWTNAPAVLVMEVLPWGVNLGLSLGLLLTVCGLETG